MCKVKSCGRPSFVGGLCGYHALEGWSGARHADRKTPPSRVAPAPAIPRRRSVARPASG